jgi:hypothetical protein
MSDPMEMQRRYFAARLQRMRTAPGLNRDAIADAERHLATLEETGSPERFMDRVKAEGNMISTSKAEAADRIRNRRRLYEVLGQARKAEMEEKRLAAVEAAATHQELAASLETLETESRLEYRENQAIMTVGSLIQAVFHLATDPPGSDSRRRNLTNLRSYWDLLSQADSGASWEKLITYPPYRDRIIFTDAQLEVLRPVFEEARRG